MAQGPEWGSAISWVVVFIGWLVVNRQHNKRETRKEVRAGLNDLIKLLDNIEDLSLEYHTSESDLAKARKIRRGLAQIFPRLKNAFFEYPAFSASREVVAFRQAIT